METAIKLFVGAAVGALLGVLLGRARVCSARACNVKATMILSIVAGAIFGAAVAWWAMNR